VDRAALFPSGVLSREEQEINQRTVQQGRIKPKDLEMWCMKDVVLFCTDNKLTRSGNNDRSRAFDWLEHEGVRKSKREFRVE
jgi:hypothetical protein